MKNELLAVTLCVCLTGALVGCGGQPAASSGEPGESESETGSVAESAQPSPEPAAQPELREADYTGIETAANGAKVSVHDPSIKVFDGRYYIYGSHMTGAVSEDLHTWEYIGNGYSSDNALFEDLFNEELTVFDYSGDQGNGNYAVWAEDVMYNEVMGKYVMYFCTSSTYIKSNLCYATADQPEGPYEYQGALLYSGFTEEDIGQTDVYDYVDEAYAAGNYLTGNGQYNNQDWPICIVPTRLNPTLANGCWAAAISPSRGPISNMMPTRGIIICI